MRSLLLCLLFSLTLLASAQERTYDLIYKPKFGDVARYELGLDTKAEGVAVFFKAQILVTVKKVSSNGFYTLETRYSDAKIVVNNEEHPLGDSSGDKPTVETFNPHGDPTTIEEEPDQDDVLGSLVSRTLDFKSPDAPVAVGATWKRTEKAKGKQAAASAEFKLEEVKDDHGVPVARVTFNFLEEGTDNPVKAAGFFLLRVSDFSVIQAEETVENLRMDKDSEPTTAKITYKRT